MVASVDPRVEAKEAYFDDNFEAALDLLTQAIKGGPPSADLHSDRAQVHLKLKNYQEAIADCDEAIQLNPKSFKAYQRQGVSYMNLNIFDKAIASLKKAVSLVSDDRTRSLLDECYAKMKIQVIDATKPIKADTLTGSVTIEESTNIEKVDVARSQDSTFFSVGKADRPITHTADNSKLMSNNDEVAKEDDALPKKVFIIYDNRMLQHRPKSDSDSEKPQRVERIVKALEDANILTRCDVSAKAPCADRRYVLAVHDEDYIKAIEELSPKGRQPRKLQKYFHTEIVASRGTAQAVFLSAGAVLEACRRVATCGNESAFAIVRPPGHHAKSAFGSGFCFFNNVAIAARYLQSENMAKKVLIVDFDVHFGDGTEAIFDNDKSVMYCSVHRNDKFPFSEEIKEKENQIGSGEGRGFNVNIGLQKNLTDGDMLAVFDFVFLPIAKQFQPDFVLVSAGYDAGVKDPLGESEVTSACFRELVWKLKSILNGKLVLALEGGYCVESLSECVVESVKGLVDGRGPEFVKTNYKGACQITWDKISKMYNELGSYWPIFADGFKQPEDELT